MGSAPVSAIGSTTAVPPPAVIRGQRGLGIGGHSSPYRGGTDSWITPKWIIDALGPFALDPCASIPQPWTCAARQYTKESGYGVGGLALPWEGSVWLNPPYGPETAKWLARLSAHGDGIALLFARTETHAFFDYVWTRATALLFLKDRLFFHYPDGTRAPYNSGAPSVLVAYGSGCAATLRGSKIPGAFTEKWS